ncbi:MAG TPA: YncE family protein [Candidatus Dormibacteraeota bacterium]|nr:YncE family protein [Candidatus Dormibacteraeota bacterium]
MKGFTRFLLLGVLVGAFGLTSNSFAAGKTKTMLYVTNSGGDSVTVINLDTMKTVGNIVLGKQIHGACAPADGRTIFFTVMSTRTLKIVDTATNKVLGTIPLISHPFGGRPNECASTPDGHYVAVPMRFYGKAQPTHGSMDIVDMHQKKVVKVLPILFPHNCFRAESNDFLYCETRAKGEIYRLNLKTMSFDETFPSGADPRPFVIDTKTKKIYVALGGFHGFAVVNMENKEVQRVALPPGPPEPAACQKYEKNTPTHGMDITPDGKELWVTSLVDGGVYAYNLATKKFSQEIHTGACPNWVSITPNGKYVTVSNSIPDTTSVIDTKTQKVVANFKVGKTPRRLLAINVPVS